MARFKRFYQTAESARGEDGFRILLDGKPVKTPAQSVFAVPSAALAAAIAAEWRAQGDSIDPATMPLFRLANTALARLPDTREGVIEQTLGYGRSDLLCYRAEAPAALVARQDAAWTPLLDWAAQRFGARLHSVSGISYVSQSETALAALRTAITASDDFALTALSAATALTGSLVLGLALREGQIDTDTAFALATLDEMFQAEQWGEDAEAMARLAALRAELADIVRFMRLAAGENDSDRARA